MLFNLKTVKAKLNPAKACVRDNSSMFNPFALLKVRNKLKVLASENARFDNIFACRLLTFINNLVFFGQQLHLTFGNEQH